MQYYAKVLEITLLYTNFVVAMYLMTGLTGLLSLGQGAFISLGAYTAALVVLRLGWHPAARPPGGRLRGRGQRPAGRPAHPEAAPRLLPAGDLGVLRDGARPAALGGPADRRRHGRGRPAEVRHPAAHRRLARGLRLPDRQPQEDELPSGLRGDPRRRDRRRGHGRQRLRAQDQGIRARVRDQRLRRSPVRLQHHVHRAQPVRLAGVGQAHRDRVHRRPQQLLRRPDRIPRVLHLRRGIPLRFCLARRDPGPAGDLRGHLPSQRPVRGLGVLADPAVESVDPLARRRGTGEPKP